MPLGKPRTFDKKFKFVVEIDGFSFAGFQKCSELSAEVAEVAYHEGGTLIANKSPGRITVPDITLERGATRDADMFNWFKQVANQVANGGGTPTSLGSGLVEPDFKRSMDIVQLDRDGSELRRWTVEGAWPKKFVAGEWDNESDENVIEKMTLAIDTFDKTNGT